MSTETYSAFRGQPCPRCRRPTYVGRCDGLTWRVNATAVPAAHGALLAHYGTALLVLTQRGNALWPETYDPHRHASDQPNRWLVAPHVCSAAAA